MEKGLTASSNLGTYSGSALWKKVLLPPQTWEHIRALLCGKRSYCLLKPGNIFGLCFVEKGLTASSNLGTYSGSALWKKVLLPPQTWEHIRALLCGKRSYCLLKPGNIFGLCFVEKGLTASSNLGTYSGSALWKKVLLPPQTWEHIRALLLKKGLTASSNLGTYSGSALWKKVLLPPQTWEHIRALLCGKRSYCLLKPGNIFGLCFVEKGLTASSNLGTYSGSALWKKVLLPPQTWEHIRALLLKKGLTASSNLGTYSGSALWKKVLLPPQTWEHIRALLCGKRSYCLLKPGNIFGLCFVEKGLTASSNLGTYSGSAFEKRSYCLLKPGNIFGLCFVEKGLTASSNLGTYSGSALWKKVLLPPQTWEHIRALLCGKRSYCLLKPGNIFGLCFVEKGLTASSNLGTYSGSAFEKRSYCLLKPGNIFGLCFVEKGLTASSNLGTYSGSALWKKVLLPPQTWEHIRALLCGKRSYCLLKPGNIFGLCFVEKGLTASSNLGTYSGSALWKKVLLPPQTWEHIRALLCGKRSYCLLKPGNIFGLCFVEKGLTASSNLGTYSGSAFEKRSYCLLKPGNIFGLCFVEKGLTASSNLGTYSGSALWKKVLLPPQTWEHIRALLCGKRSYCLLKPGNIFGLCFVEKGLTASSNLGTYSGSALWKKVLLPPQTWEHIRALLLKKGLPASSNLGTYSGSALWKKVLLLPQTWEHIRALLCGKRSYCLLKPGNIFGLYFVEKGLTASSNLGTYSGSALWKKVLLPPQTWEHIRALLCGKRSYCLLKPGNIFGLCF